MVEALTGNTIPSRMRSFPIILLDKCHFGTYILLGFFFLSKTCIFIVLSALLAKITSNKVQNTYINLCKSKNQPDNRSKRSISNKYKDNIETSKTSYVRMNHCNSNSIDL